MAEKNILPNPDKMVPFLAITDEEKKKREEERRKAELQRKASEANPLRPFTSPPTKEDIEKRELKDLEQAERAQEWYGGVLKRDAARYDERVKKALVAQKDSFLKSFSAPTPALETQQPPVEKPEDAVRLDSVWKSIVDSSNRNWTEDDEGKKRRAIADFSRVMTEVRTDPALYRMFNQRANASSYAEEAKILRAIHDSIAWAHFDKTAPVNEEDRKFLGHMEANLPPEPSMARAAARLRRSTKGKAPEKAWVQTFFRKPALSDLHPAAMLRDYRNLFRAVGRDAVEGIKSMQLTPTGVRGTKTPLGEIAALPKGEESFEAWDVRRQREPWVTGMGGLVGDLGPELLAFKLGGPLLSSWLKTARLPASADKLLGSRSYRKSAEGIRNLNALSDSTALSAAGGAFSYAERGDPVEAVSAGLMWSTFPVAHRAASQGLGDILTSVSRRLPQKLVDATKFERAVVADTAGLGAVLAVMEAPSIAAWFEAETDEEKDRIVGEALGKAAAFALLGYGRQAMAEGKGQLTVPTTPKGRRVRGPEAQKALQLERDANLAIEEIKGNPQAMKQIRDSLDKHWDAHEAVPRGQGVAVLVARMKDFKKGKPKKVQDVIDSMIEEVRAGTLKVPKPMPLEEGKPVPELREVEEPTTPVEAEGLDVITPEQGKLWHLTPAENAESVASKGIKLPKLEGWEEGPPRAYATYHSNSVKGMVRAIERMLSMKTNEDVANWAREKGVSEEMIRESIKNAGKRFNNETGKMERREVSPQKQYLHMQEYVERIGKLPQNEFLWNDLAVKFIGSKGVAVLEGKAPSKIPKEIAGEEITEAGVTLRDVKSLKKGADLDAHAQFPETNLDVGEVNKGGWREIYRSKAPKTPSKLGYLEPPSGAAESMKKEAALTEAVGGLERLVEAKRKAGGEAVRKLYEDAIKSGDKVKAEKLKKSLESLEVSKVPIEEQLGEAVRRDIELKKAKESKLEEAAIPPVGTPEVAEKSGELSSRMHTIIDRTTKRLREEGNSELADLLEADPRSYYDILPSSEISKTVEKMGMAEVDSALVSLGPKGGDLRIEMLLRTQKENLLYDKWKSGEGTEKAYQDYLQENADKATLYGQLIEQMKYLRTVKPEVIADKIAAIHKKEKLPPMSKENRAKLIKLIERSVETRKKSKAADEAWREDQSDKNFETALREFETAERAGREQFAFMSEIRPKLWSDIYVSLIQGNFLTPSTLSLNVLGNIVPLPLRVGGRTAAKALDLLDEFFRKPARLNELKALKEDFKVMEEGDPNRTKRAADISKLERLTGTESMVGVEPLGGYRQKWLEGFAWRGTGLKRLQEALRAPKGEKWDRLKDAVQDDALSSILFGQRVNIQEIGTDINPVSPLNSLRAWGRVIESIRLPSSQRKVSETAKLIVEGTVGVPADIMFRLLAAGDLPFRIGELNRLISIEGKLKKWDADKIFKAQERPDLFFNEKKLADLKNDAAKASFQNEGAVTKAVNRVNQWFKGIPYAGPSVYAGWRTTTPYQKTLLNILGETAAYTPLGYIDTLITAHQHGMASRKTKMSLGRAMVGTAMYKAVEYLMNKDIVSTDLDPKMAVTKEGKQIRYMTEEAFPQGYMNMSALMRLYGGEDTKFQKGDWVMDMRKIGPMGFKMLANASIVSALERLPEDKRKEIEESWSNMFVHSAKTEIGYLKNFSLNQSFATGARNFVQALADPDPEIGHTRMLMPLGKALPTAVFPNTLDWWYKQRSKYRRNFRPDSVTDALVNTWNQKMAAMGWRELDDPFIIDLWGTNVDVVPETIKGNANRFLFSTFNVVKARQQIPDPSSSEVYRLWREGKDNSVVPPLPSRYLTKDGKQFKLNRDQYALYSMLVGRYRLHGATSLHQTSGTRMEEKSVGVADYVSDFDGKVVDRAFANGLPQGLKWKDRPDFEGDASKAAVLRGIYSKAQRRAKEDFFIYIEDWRRWKESKKPEDKPEELKRAEKLSIQYKDLVDLEEVKKPSGRRDNSSEWFYWNAVQELLE